MKKLDESIKECKEHPERLIEFDYEKLCEEYGIPITEEYPEEDEMKRRYYEAGMEYTRYCKTIELQRIKNLLTKEIMEQ